MALPVGRRAEVRRASQTPASGQASYPIEYTPQSPDFPALAIAASSSDTSPLPFPSPLRGRRGVVRLHPPAFVN